MKLDRPSPVLACRGEEGQFEVHCARDPGGNGLHLSITEKKRGLLGRILGSSAKLARLSSEVEAAATNVVGPLVKQLP